MTSKNISLTEEAYKRLKRIKGEDKSFTDIILELTKNVPSDFSDIIGAEIDIDWDEIMRSRKKSAEDKKRENLLLRH
ncbi:MAG TPA: hypothetical protein EYP86_05295 [Candidatus Altiarchaeales archaeon]|nr:hypothetical protein [Candidatus Altiarchaeales archaeon]